MKRLLLFLPIACLILASMQAFPQQKEVSIEKRVHISKKGGHATINGKMSPGTSYAYKVSAQKGQKMEAHLTMKDGAATFSVVPPGPELLENSGSVMTWSGNLPQTGDYSIIVVAQGKEPTKVHYTLEISLK
jgi:hypothetical protein